MLFLPTEISYRRLRAPNLFILKGLDRIPFNLKFTEARYGMSGEIRYSGTASGWSG
jgi:hypothetical protein